MKIAFKVLEFCLLVGSLAYVCNATFQFRPEAGPEVSLGWACLFLLIALYNKEEKV
jgi:hypothetical protein